MVSIIRCENSTVTDFYLDIIQKMVEHVGDEAINCTSLTEISSNKNEYLVTSSEVDFFNAYIKGYKNQIIWFQGILPEESFLKHHSYVRKIILEMMARLALKKAKGIFYVSETMKQYMEKKYRIDTKNRSFVMPCFNETINQDLFFSEGKYSNNDFCYVGSLSVWQCFEKTIDLYKCLEQRISNARLFVYTSERNEAERILKNKGVLRYSVDFVKQEEITKRIGMAKFGFVLRDNIAVNNVATPTKLSTYLAAGVIPIYSDSIVDFYKQADKMHYAVSVGKDFKLPQHLLELCETPIDPKEVLAEYNKVFQSYYSVERYINESVDFIKKALNI